jgi:hypothetical protein
MATDVGGEGVVDSATVHGLRQRIAGWHFAKESLTRGEREILYVAEQVDKHLAALEARCREVEQERDKHARISDERHDALSAERRKNDTLRAQLHEREGQVAALHAAIEADFAESGCPNCCDPHDPKQPYRVHSDPNCPWQKWLTDTRAAALTHDQRIAREARREMREEAAQLALTCHGAGAHTKPQQIIADAIRRLPDDPPAENDDHPEHCLCDRCVCGGCGQRHEKCVCRTAGKGE